jgi:hypothetical protein
LTDRRLTQSPVEGRNTVGSARRSPSKSPDFGCTWGVPRPSGTSPLRPQTTVSVASVTRFLKYHVPVERRNTPSSATPSPLRSSGTGTSPVDTAPQLCVY